MKELHRTSHLILRDAERDAVFGRCLGHGDDAGAVFSQRPEGVRYDAGLIPTWHSYDRDRGDSRNLRSVGIHFIEAGSGAGHDCGADLSEQKETQRMENSRHNGAFNGDKEVIFFHEARVSLYIFHTHAA